jgi:DNA-binding response OmpR family regulator
VTSADADRPLILAADDDGDILALVSFRLGRAGYSVITAEDGLEALALARERKPDLLILDVRMPKMTGLEVVSSLREEEGLNGVPVLLLTASVQDESVKRGFDAGADDYIKKPFSPEELASRVQAILAGRS